MWSSVPLDSKDPGDSNELEETDKQEWNSGSKLVKEREEVDSIAEDKGDTHYEEH